jgi:hypothetical protein
VTWLEDNAREALVARAARAAALHELSRERAAFHGILTEIHQIWRKARASELSVKSARVLSADTIFDVGPIDLGQLCAS